MRKKGKIAVLIACVLIIASLCGCSFFKKESVICAVVTYDTEYEFMMATVPSFSVAVLPEAKAKLPDGSETTVQTGDIIKMVFDSNIYIRETHPAVYIDGPSEVFVAMRNVSFYADEEFCFLAIPLSEIDGEIKQDSVVDFTFDNGQTIAYSTVIDSFNKNTATLKGDAGEIKKIIDNIAFGAEIKIKS